MICAPHCVPLPPRRSSFMGRKTHYQLGWVRSSPLSFLRRASRSSRAPVTCRSGRRRRRCSPPSSRSFSPELWVPPPSSSDDMSRALPIISLLTAAAIGADALFGARPLVLGAKASAHIREAAGTLAPVIGVDERRSKRDVRAIQRELRRRAAGAYIGEMLLSRDSSLARWPERRARPIRVWIQPTSDLPDWTSTYVDEVYAAFDEWDALDLPVSFTYVADSTDAEVHVTWIDHFREPISGRTKWARDDDWWITDAAIVLAVHHHKGDVLDEDAMRAMALHEIGHLLGLDHTYDVRSIMAPKVRVRALSSADKATVRLLYTLPPGAVR